MGQEVVRAEDAGTVDDEIDVTTSEIIEMVSAQFAGLRPGEITIRMYMRSNKELRYQQVEYRLNKMVELGLMTRRLVLHDGARRLAFAWVGNENDGRGQDGDDSEG